MNIAIAHINPNVTIVGPAPIVVGAIHAQKGHIDLDLIETMGIPGTPALRVVQHITDAGGHPVKRTTLVPLQHVMSLVLV